MRRRARRPSAPPKQQLLEALGAARRLAIQHGAAQPSYSSPTYRLCDAVKAAVDEFAADVTGDPEHFHAKPHGGAWVKP